jgi:hypothetical protein
VRILLAAGDDEVGIPVMLKKPLHGIASICFVAVCASLPLPAQQPPIPAPTIRVQSSLVLVDVITQDRESGLPVRDFNKDDFRLFDNGREVRIATFDAGGGYDTRAVTLWFVVICNEGGLPKLGASAEFLGQESLFCPALKHLETQPLIRMGLGVVTLVRVAKAKGNAPVSSLRLEKLVNVCA